MKVLIVGGGVAGLAIAWRVARQGAQVELVERWVCGRSASWAAAGMLAPEGELAGETNALAAFARRSHSMWPRFAAELETATGAALGYRKVGSLLVARTEAQAISRARNTGSGCWLTPKELQSREPSLSRELLGAQFFPDDAQVNNRVLCQALTAAVRASGVAIRENCAVLSVIATNGKAVAVISDSGVLEADAIVLACGAWMNLIDVPDVELPPVKPVKGQMVACIPPGQQFLPSSLIWSDNVYLVPRPDRLLLGATVQDAGFDISVEFVAVRKLVSHAACILPELSNWRVAESWAGLRPQTPDDAPVLGASLLSGLYIAGGQFRNGILFAPAVAEWIAGVLRGENPDEFATAFDPLRFGT